MPGGATGFWCGQGTVLSRVGRLRGIVRGVTRRPLLQTLVLAVGPVLVLVLGVGCASAPVALDVMSFNIRYANPDDGDDFWERRTELVFGVIRDHDPDVVGLQEALPGQMDALRAAFPDYRFVGQGRGGGNRGEFSALMIRDARLDVVESGDFWLSPTPDEVGSQGWDASLPRMCTWAVLRDRRSAADILVMNTHFDHRGAEARRASAGVILERRDRHAALPTIVTGDLNAGEGSPPLVVFHAAGLRDTLRDAHPDATEVGTFNGFQGTSDGAKIDYVLVDDAWTTHAAAIVRDHTDGRYPSDHFAVLATVVLRPPTERAGALR